MKIGENGIIVFKMYDLDMTAVNKLIFTFRGIEKIEKEYPSEYVNYADNRFYVGLTQEDTLILSRNRRVKVQAEAQICYTNGAVAKSEIISFVLGETLNTTIIPGNSPSDFVDDIEFHYENGIIIIGGSGLTEERVREIIASYHFATESELENYVTLSALNAALSQYVTQNGLNDAIATYIDENIHLDDYATKEELNDYPTKTEVAEDLTSKQDKMQFSIMPTAAVEYNEKIVQFVGTTTEDYVNGFFYKCVGSAGGYSWIPWEQELTVDTADQLKALKVKEGTKITVTSRKTTYTVVDTPSATADNIFDILMTNGLHAVMEYDSNMMINAIVGDVEVGNNVSDELNTLITACVGKVKGIMFEAGTYFIDKPVYLKSIDYECNNGMATLKRATAFDVTGYASWWNAIFYTHEGNHEAHTFSTHMKNIRLAYTTSSDNTPTDMYCVLFSARNMVDCYFDNCEFDVRPSDVNGVYTKSTTVFSQDNDVLSNVNFTNCKFANRTGLGATQAELEQDFLAGSVFIITGKTKNDVSVLAAHDITFDKCRFEQSTSDELITTGNGVFNNYTIKDCEFETLAGGHYNNNMVVLHGGTGLGEYHNAEIVGCRILAGVPTRKIFKFDKLSNGADITVKDTYVKTTYSVESAIGDMHGVICLSSPLTVVETGVTPIITIEDCNFDIAEGSYIHCFLELLSKNHAVRFKNCDINWALTNSEKAVYYWGMFTLNTTDSSLTVDRCSINSDIRLSSVSNSSADDITFNNNILDTVIENIFKNGTEAINLSFVDNYIKSTSDVQYIVYTQNAVGTYTKSNALVGGTRFEFGSNTKSLYGHIYKSQSNRIAQNDYINLILGDTSPNVFALPDASIDYVDSVYLLAREQTGYVKGGIYECQEVTPSTSPATYHWVQIGVSMTQITELLSAITSATDFADLQSRLQGYTQS